MGMGERWKLNPRNAPVMKHYQANWNSCITIFILNLFSQNLINKIILRCLHNTHLITFNEQHMISCECHIGKI